MSAPNISGIFRLGVDVLRTYVSDKTKAVLAQTGDVMSRAVDDGEAVAGLTETDDVVWWQHVGFKSRPSKAQAGQAACQALVIRDTQNDVCFASRDLRGLDLAGSLQEGETCVYAAGETGTGQARILLKANGNVALYTTNGNTSSGTSVTIQCNGDGTIYLASEFGGISIENGAIKVAHSSGAGVQLDASGVALLGNTLALNGSAVSLGTGGGTGVLTYLSTAPFGALLVAAGASAAAMAIAASPFIQACTGPTNDQKSTFDAAVKAFGVAVAAAAASFILPTNASLNVKSS